MKNRIVFAKLTETKWLLTKEENGQMVIQKMYESPRLIEIDTKTGEITVMQ